MREAAWDAVHEALPARWLVGLLLVVLALGGCDVAKLILQPGVPVGGRELLVTVINRSPAPVEVVVAADLDRPFQQVGSANPAVIPAGATIDVRFGVPSGSEWAIFVNPGGGIVIAGDVPPNAAGRMPFSIQIDPDGSAGVGMPGPPAPGWFGP